MPYMVVKRENEFCVVKKSDPGGKAFGCHPTRPKAISQMQAIVINEHKSLSDDELKELGAEIEKQLDLLDGEGECPCEKDLTLPEGDFILLEDLNALAPGWQGESEVKEGGIPGPENRMGNIPPQMLAGLCKKIGKDPGFYTRCVAHKFGGKVTDVKAFCADLHKSCVGKFPGEHPKKKEADEMDWKAWAKEQFDSLSGRLDALVSQVKEQLHAKQPAAKTEPDEGKKAKCPKCGKSSWLRVASARSVRQR